MKDKFFWPLFFTVFFETADLRNYCGYFLAICWLCLYFSLSCCFNNLLRVHEHQKIRQPDVGNQRSLFKNYWLAAKSEFIFS